MGSIRGAVVLASTVKIIIVIFSLFRITGIRVRLPTQPQNVHFMISTFFHHLVCCVQMFCNIQGFLSREGMVTESNYKVSYLGPYLHFTRYGCWKLVGIRVWLRHRACGTVGEISMLIKFCSTSTLVTWFTTD